MIVGYASVLVLPLVPLSGIVVLGSCLAVGSIIIWTIGTRRQRRAANPFRPRRPDQWRSAHERTVQSLRDCVADFAIRLWPLTGTTTETGASQPRASVDTAQWRAYCHGVRAALRTHVHTPNYIRLAFMCFVLAEKSSSSALSTSYRKNAPMRGLSGQPKAIPLRCPQSENNPAQTRETSHPWV